MTPPEKDADRSGLYQSKAVQQFTGLDENLDAGLTLIEEVLLNRHQQPPGKALVLGCGPGRECAALARRGFEVTGLDREPGMLEMARALMTREDVDARFVVGEADGFDLPGEVFSTVFVFSGLYNMLLPRSRRVDLLKSGYRHLEPGGRLLVTFLSDYVRPDSAPPVEKGSVWSSINPSHQEGDLYLINEAVHIFPHPDRFEAEAREAGFQIDSLFRDQRAYDRATRQVRGYAVLVRP
jgi:SAM-dependent methyltransferase